MPENGTPSEEVEEDRSNETLTPQEAYRLREDVGLQNKTVAQMFDVTPGYVSQLYSQYEDAKEEGKSEVEVSDFERTELEEAIQDKETESPYHTACPACDESIPTPETAGQNPCPECGETLNWDESEI